MARIRIVDPVPVIAWCPERQAVVEVPFRLAATDLATGQRRVFRWRELERNELDDCYELVEA